MRLRYLRRWSTASKALLVLSLACGVGAFLVVRGYAARVEALRPAVGPRVPVVVAATQLARGSIVRASMLRAEEVPAAFAPPGALDDPAAADGRTLLAGLAEGEPLTELRLGASGEGPVAALVPPGLRAFTVEAGVPADAIRPGDRVDVLATFGGGRPYTETVAAGLEVLLVLEGGATAGTEVLGAPATGGAGGPALVLLVAPEQAERLAYARAFAELSVSIAGSDPASAVPSPGATPSTLEPPGAAGAAGPDAAEALPASAPDAP